MAAGPTRKQLTTWLIAALALVLAWLLRSVLAYFLVAIIVSFIAAPAVNFTEKKLRTLYSKTPRSIAVLLVLFAFVAIMVGFLSIIVPPLVDQSTAIRNVSQAQFEASFGEPMKDLERTAVEFGVPAEKLTVAYFKSRIQDFLNTVSVKSLAGNVISSISATVGWIFAVFFISFFFLSEKFLIYRLLHTFTPEKYENQMQRIMRELNEMLGRYFRSLLLQILVFGSYIYIGLLIAGEKYALTVAIFSGVINLISYIGPLMGLSFALIFSILSHIGASFYGVILPEMTQVLIVYGIAILLDNLVSYPLIFSNSLKVHPLELFFVILAGAQLAGLPGMMVAAPFYTVLRIIAKELFSRFEFVQNITRKL